jgi:hypothetical protein
MEEIQPMTLIRRHRRLAVVALLMTLAIAGVATAYWTQGGSGTGSGSTGTTASITVNQTSTVANLYPGGTPQALSGNFTNPNPSNVFVTSVTAVVDPTFNSQTDGTKPACTAADFVIAGAAPVNAQIASGAGVGAWGGLTIQMVNAPTNQDNCKNVSVPIVYTSN